MVVRGEKLADHVHGSGRVAAAAMGVEVDGARRRVDLLDEGGEGRERILE